VAAVSDRRINLPRILRCKKPMRPSFSAPVRNLLIACLLLLPVCCAHAQQQERKLVDRIMEPDMSLENDAQNKKFTSDKTSVNKPAHVSTFYLQQKSPAKKYSGTRDFSSNEYNTRDFNQRDQTQAARMGQKQASTSSYSEGSKTARTRTIADQNKTQSSRDYAGNRPYLEQGKSQKSLNRKNKPMTVDEVRELLNKNK
jgi:hypothetical protein